MNFKIYEVALVKDSRYNQTQWMREMNYNIIKRE